MALRKLHDAKLVPVGFGRPGPNTRYRVSYAKGKTREIRLLSQQDYGQDTRLHWSQPVKLWTETVRGETYWWYQNDLYVDTDGHSSEEVQLLLWQQQDARKSRFQRLRKEMLAETAAQQARRETIPEDVRTLVWRRDEGKCAQCGSREKLEFDHIIPVAKGGGNTARNIQLLCETCNRKKSAHI